MAQVLTSVSGLQISAASAGFAPTNSGDVSAIASGYQVVSATATQLYAGTAFLTSVNGDPISASRAGQAANASMANSAYYDGTGRLISALPDSAAVSSIASSYAESAASGKLDSTAQVVSSTAGDGTYVTSINGMGISGQGGGGAQVVTATGSASAMEGWLPPFTTSYLVSSINGSAILPYGYSALSGNSANWNNTRTAVTANSANWNAVYNTVSSNSASWSGSTGGSVTSPSGTILVMNGNEVEGTNSAVLTASGGEGFEELLYSQNQHLGTYMQLLAYGPVPGTGATLMMPLDHYGGSETRVTLSGRDGDLYISASGLIPSTASIAYIPMGGIRSAISASADNWFDLTNEQLTAKKEGGILVTGVGELAWKSAVDNVTNTVAFNSATWSQGGVDSATVSAIASAYQVVSAVGDDGTYITSINGSALSGAGGGASMPITGSAADGYTRVAAGKITISSTADSSTAFITNRIVNVSDGSTQVSIIASSIGIQDTAGQWSEVSPADISSWNGKLDATAFNSGDFYTTANESGYVDSATVSAIASSYAESAASSKQDSSAMSAYALSSDVSGCISAVSANSAYWDQGGVITATGSGKVSGTGISSLNGSSIIAKSLSDAGRIMIGSSDAGMYLTGGTNGGTAYYKSNEMVINRSSYGEQVKFNLGSAGSQVYGSASGERGAFIQMNNDFHRAFLGALSGKDGILELDGYSANSASMYAWDGVVDTVSSNSASWAESGVDSATVSSIASSYAESAASSKQDTSAMTSYALSADVSGTVDLVSTQSANWGGSALALSAGPGIYLTMVGNTLVISTAVV